MQGYVLVWHSVVKFGGTLFIGTMFGDTLFIGTTFGVSTLLVPCWGYLVLVLWAMLPMLQCHVLPLCCRLLPTLMLWLAPLTQTTAWAATLTMMMMRMGARGKRRMMTMTAICPTRWTATKTWQVRAYGCMCTIALLSMPAPASLLPPPAPATHSFNPITSTTQGHSSLR